MIKNLKGFTLAEVLITISIIGVVAILIVPVLLTNMQKKVYVQSIKNVYSEIQQALKKELYEEETDRWMPSCSDTESCRSIAETFLKSRFNYSTDCGKNFESCFAKKYSLARKTHPSTWYLSSVIQPSSYAINLSNGTAIAMYINPSRDDLNKGYSAIVYVDTNGQKLPNKHGRDFFILPIFPDLVVTTSDASECKRKGGKCGNIYYSASNPYNWTYSYCPDEIFSYNYSGHLGLCIAYLLKNNWNMNY